MYYFPASLEGRMWTARIFGCPIVTSPQFVWALLLALCLIASARSARIARAAYFVLARRRKSVSATRASSLRCSGGRWGSCRKECASEGLSTGRAIRFSRSGGMRFEPAYFVRSQTEEHVCSRPQHGARDPRLHARCSGIAIDSTRHRGGSSARSLRRGARFAVTPGSADSSGRERAKRRPRVIASRSAYASRGSVGL